jgi:glycosyltransferase involved in cell wall biosynthesis
VFYSAVNVHRRWRWPYRSVERFTLGCADGAHAPNRDVPAILRAKGFSTQPVGTIPLGVDAARFAASEPMPMPGIARPRVGYVGRLEPVKGLDVLLDAFQLVSSEASLIVAGDGTDRVRLLPRLQSDRVHLRSAVSYEHMPAFLKSLDVLVLPSVTIPPQHREQFGRVLVEAMAAGVAVVGSDSGAIPEVIGEAGLVVPERDPRALAGAINRVLGDAHLRSSLVERGRQRVQSHFAWSVVAQQTLDLFQAAVAHRRGAAADLAVVRA